MIKFYYSGIFVLIFHVINVILKGVDGNQQCKITEQGHQVCCDRHGRSYHSKSDITCYNIKNFSTELFSFPTEYELIKLSFLNSSLNKIPSRAFHTFSDLRNLYLNRTGINTVEMSAFVGLTELNELHLENNNISEIEIGTLNHLLKLETLVLSDNNLENLNENVFKDSLNLKRLYLNKNKLQKLEKGVFSSLLNTNEIDLSQNYLRTFNFSLFYSLGELRLLNLSGNQIQSLPSSLFKDLVKLDVLDISKNLLLTIPYGILSGLNEVMYLNVSHNRLTVIDVKSLYSLKNLTELNVAENSLRHLDAEELTSLFKKLKHINLNENSWTCDILFEILKSFRIADVFVESGNNYTSDNLHGIHCSPVSSLSSEPMIMTNLTSPIKGEHIQSYYQQSASLLTEISEKISKNNNLIEKVVENVQIIKAQEMENGVKTSNNSVISSQHQTGNIEGVTNILVKLYNAFNRTYHDSTMVELTEAKHLLEGISNNFERMIHLQESTYQRQPQLNNINAPHTTTHINNTNTSTSMDDVDTFMKNVSDNIGMLLTKINQLITFYGSKHPELQQTTGTTSSTSAALISLSILVAILFIIMGVAIFRYIKCNYILDRLVRFKNQNSRHNKSEIDLMTNTEGVSNTQI